MLNTAAPFEFDRLASDYARASFAVSSLRFVVEFRKDPNYRGSLWYMTFGLDKATRSRFATSATNQFVVSGLATKAGLDPIGTASLVFATMVAVMSGFAREANPDGVQFGARGAKRMELYGRIADRELRGTEYRREFFEDLQRFLVVPKDASPAEISRIKDWIEMSAFIRRAEIRKGLRLRRKAHRDLLSRAAPRA